MSTAITTLFLDVGGVLLTNGWDRDARRHAAAEFRLDYAEMDERHHLTYDTYESGRLSLDEYLRRIVFYEPRPFTPEQFKRFMFAQSRPNAEMISLVRDLKHRQSLRVAVVSNEGRELAVHRVRAFNLSSFVDFFIFSSFVHIRKPDIGIYRLALDISQADADRVVYLDDRGLFVEVARTLGIHGIHHTELAATKEALASQGLL